MQIEVKNIRAGDLVDLQGDKFADPKRDNIFLESECVIVLDTDQENSECVAILFDGFDLVGFPSEHKLTVYRD